MKSLKKNDIEKRDEYAKKLREQAATLKARLVLFNSEMQRLFEADVAPALADYNALLEEVSGWREDLLNEMNDYYDARSEKWQESDAATNFEAWRDEYEGIDLDEVELPAPDPLTPPIDLDEAHANALDNLPTEVEG